MPDLPPISKVLDNVNQEDNASRDFLIAATINLYIESLRRTDGRVMLMGQDIPALFLQIQMLTNPRPYNPTAEPKVRSRALSTEENISLLNAVEQGAAQLRRDSNGS